MRKMRITDNGLYLCGLGNLKISSEIYLLLAMKISSEIYLPLAIYFH